MQKDVSFRVNLLMEKGDKVNHIKKLIKKYPFIKTNKSIYWKTNFNEAINTFKLNRIKLKKKKWNKGELAIWATYINAYINFLKEDKKYKYLVLLEDDVILSKNFLYMLYKYYIKNGYVKNRGAVRLSKVNRYDMVGVIYYKPYLIHILNFIRNVGIRKPIDVQLMKTNFIKKSPFKIVSYNKKIKSERLKSDKIKFK